MDGVIPIILMVGSYLMGRCRFGEYISSLSLLMTLELDLWQETCFFDGRWYKNNIRFQSQLPEFLIKMILPQYFFHSIPCVALA